MKKEKAGGVGTHILPSEGCEVHRWNQQACRWCIFGTTSGVQVTTEACNGSCCCCLLQITGGVCSTAAEEGARVHKYVKWMRHTWVFLCKAQTSGFAPNLSCDHDNNQENTHTQKDREKTQINSVCVAFLQSCVTTPAGAPRCIEGKRLGPIHDKWGGNPYTFHGQAQWNIFFFTCCMQHGSKIYGKSRFRKLNLHQIEKNVYDKQPPIRCRSI